MLAPAIAGHADESAVAAPAATITVTNCNNSGPGSLRAAVANAASGDRIDLTALACNRIVLTSAIQVPQNNLELVGRGHWALTIDANRTGRVFAHSGTGTLRLRRVSIANGYLTGSDISGGCIYSPGSVELIGSRVHHCELRASGGLKPFANGGGISASRVLLSYSSAFANVAASGVFAYGGAVRAGDIVLYHSHVHGNRAREGGGVFGSRMTATYSVISGNEGRGIDMPAAGDGCGSATVCTLTLNKSTVSANQGGGIWALDADDVAIIESTVSDNVAWSGSAAVLPGGGETRIFNSTIAFNQDQPTGPSAECRGAIEAFQLLRMESSIVARNTCSLIGDDYDIGDSSQGARIVGSNNIIGYSEVPVPPDTISARPRLGPLTDNGGPTPTRKPHADSPALDRGSNLLNRQYDQRGPGFPRVKGGFPDIGAVER
jgi:hypothetical protein